MRGWSEAKVRQRTRAVEGDDGFLVGAAAARENQSKNDQGGARRRCASRGPKAGLGWTRGNHFTDAETRQNILEEESARSSAASSCSGA